MDSVRRGTRDGAACIGGNVHYSFNDSREIERGGQKGECGGEALEMNSSSVVIAS